MIKNPERLINLENAFKSGSIQIFTIGESTVKDIEELIGENEGADKNTLSGTFLHWGNLRVNFDEKGMAQYADLLFLNRSTEFGKYMCDPFGDKLIINEKIDFGRLVKFLNFQKIPFEMKNSLGIWDEMKVTVSKHIDVVFRLEDNVVLDRITFNK